LKVLDLGGVGSKAIPNGLREAREGQRSYQDYFNDKYYLQDAPPPQRQQPSNLSVPKHKIIQPSPTQSFSSVISENSQEKEKKKKRGLFRF
jgi:syntaxin-binding protein 1